jgi:hypothetical protein
MGQPYDARLGVRGDTTRSLRCQMTFNLSHQRLLEPEVTSMMTIAAAGFAGRRHNGLNKCFT